MNNQLKEYKRITTRRNVINLKRQIKYTALMLFGSVLAAHLVTFGIIYLSTL